MVSPGREDTSASRARARMVSVAVGLMVHLPSAERPSESQGLPASPGAAVGKIVFNAEEAKAQTEEGEKVILVRIETSPEDIEGMHVSQGILTARGGMTSHAAVVARGMGKCCVAGCSELQINEKAKTLKIKDKIFQHILRPINCPGQIP
jgi:phosphoenolpyruvate synthase/pyruvate phosphate dikinase